MKVFTSILIIAATIGISSCKPKIDVPDSEAGDINVSNYVAIGGAMTAGYSDGALYYNAQQNSYANLLAEQFKLIGGGEFNHSSNPTLQEYEPVSDEFIFRPFVSSSDFKPYITTIGLYNDYGDLLVVGKLGQPIRTPDNTDTTFIIRYDK